MFNLQKQRMVRSELFTHWRYTSLSVEARVTLIGLLGWASDYGDVDLNTEFLTEKMFIRKGQTEGDLKEWIDELLNGEHLRPYTVKGHRYALITGWNDPYSAVKQAITKTKSTYTWRNPTPTDIHDEDDDEREDFEMGNERSPQPDPESVVTPMRRRKVRKKRPERDVEPRRLSHPRQTREQRPKASENRSEPASALSRAQRAKMRFQDESRDGYESPFKQAPYGQPTRWSG